MEPFFAKIEEKKNVYVNTRVFHAGIERERKKDECLFLNRQRVSLFLIVLGF